MARGRRRDRDLHEHAGRLSHARARLERLRHPASKIRVEAATLGGGFGGKLGLVEPLVVGAALALKRPVRLAFTRSEDFAAGNPAPGFLIDLKVGARADGTFAAVEARVLVDGGAFADMAPTALVGGRVGGPYRWEAWNVQTYGVRTNRFGPGAYRAPTATPCAFALEPLLDELARAARVSIRSSCGGGTLRSRAIHGSTGRPGRGSDSARR